MESLAGSGSEVGFQIERERGLEAGAFTRGWFDWVHEDKDGNEIERGRWYNQTCNAGLDHMLNVEFAGATQVTVWYMGLVDNAGFTALAAADTAASHAGWSENAGWSGATRPAVTFGSSSGQTVSNATQVTFTFNTSTNNIRGAFVITDNTKSGTAGTLYSTAANGAGPVGPFNSTDVLKVTYSNSLTAA